MSNSPINLSKLSQNKTVVYTLGAVLLLLIVICMVVWLPYILRIFGGTEIIGNGEETSTLGIVDPTWQPPNCEELLIRAMEASFDGCQSIGSNQVCKGHISPIDDWAGRGGLGSRLLQDHRIAACVFGGDWEDPDL